MISRIREILNFLLENPNQLSVIDFWTIVFLSIKSLFFAYLLSWLYKKHVDRFSSYFSNARSFFLFIFTFAVTLILINKNIMGSFSLIGAISIIRFRAVMKNPLDTGFFFLSLVCGASLAVNMSWIVVISFILISSILRFFPERDVEKFYRYVVLINHDEPILEKLKDNKLFQKKNLKSQKEKGDGTRESIFVIESKFDNEKMLNVINKLDVKEVSLI